VQWRQNRTSAKNEGSSGQHPRSRQLLGSSGCRLTLSSCSSTSQAGAHPPPCRSVRLALVPAARALRGARPHQPPARLPRKEPVEVPRHSDTAGVITGFYCGHLQRVFACRHSRGFGFRAGCGCWHGLRTPAVPGGSPFSMALKQGATTGRTFASPPTAPLNARAPEPTPALSGFQPTTASPTLRNLTQHAADSLRSPLMPRLGCRHPGVRCSSESRMESKHLVDLPDRAVAPGPGVGQERRRDRGVLLVSSSPGFLPAGRSPHPPAFPSAMFRTRLSRTSCRSNTPSYSTAAPRGTGRSSSPPRFCLRVHGFLLRPSTAGVRRPAFVAPQLPAGMQLFAPASVSSRPWRVSVLKRSEPGSHQEPRLRIPSGHPPEGPSAITDTGRTGSSNNRGQTHAAQPNPSMQRTRSARR
jgi:hypothetical protein